MKKIALLGYGAIATLHAAQLRDIPGVAVGAVFGPDANKATRFAELMDIPRATDDLAAALQGMDAAIICSPSEHHVAQAQIALDRVPAVLVELPACASAAEAESLADAASRQGSALHCAHTSRYLRAYRDVGKWLRIGDLGSVLQVRYARAIPPRNRSWVDDALVHHAAHPLDLLLAWFGEVQPRGCVTLPGGGPPQDTTLLAALADGAPVSVSISYCSRIAVTSMTVIGNEHTIETDGFSFLKSDRQDFSNEFDGQAEYEAAIAAQDRAFLAGAGVPWSETARLASLVDEFRSLARSQMR
jgi:2-hydroxy-4-carboxymuconate semialdehyde hemiacetal dehydrogenase